MRELLTLDFSKNNKERGDVEMSKQKWISILMVLRAMTVASSSLAEGEYSVSEIPITDVCPVSIGQIENAEAGTGCTVFICAEGMRAGLDVRGGGPASRESQLLNPLMAAFLCVGMPLLGIHVLVCGVAATGGLLRRLSGSRLFWLAAALLAAANWAYLLTKA